MIPFFQGFEVDDTTGMDVLGTGSTITRVLSGTNGICGPIAAFNGNYYAVITPGTDPYGYITDCHFGDTPGGNGGDFIAGPPYPPNIGDFTQSIAIYIPVTGLGAWAAAPLQSVAAFQIYGNCNNILQDYDLEQPEFYFGVPGGGLPVSIFYNTGGWEVSATPGIPIASITTNGWYTFAATIMKTGDRVNDPTAAVLAVYNAAGNLIAPPFPIPGWQPDSAEIPYAGQLNAQNGPPPPSSNMLGSVSINIESWQTPQNTGNDPPVPGGFPTTWQPAGICIDNIQTLAGQFNSASVPVFSNLVSGQMLNGAIGVPFALTLSASNTTAYYITGYNAGVCNWVVDGLPPGLVLNPITGAITGIPTGAASYSDLLVMAANGTSFTLLRVHFNIAAAGTPGGGSVITTMDSSKITMDSSKITMDSG